MSLVSLAALFYFGSCAYLYFGQRSLLYYPTGPSSSAAAPRLEVQSGGETLKIWQASNTGGDAIIYFGGNAEDVAWNIEDFRRLFADRSVYLVNYRGYGGSTGSPSESALYADALEVFDELGTRHRRVSVIGRSLGSGVAAYLASERDVHKLVLVTPFDSIENVARRWYPIFPVSLLLQDKYDSLARVPAIKAPTLILVAERDRVIPRSHSEALAAAFPRSQVSVAVIEDTTHDSIGSTPEYASRLRDFL